MLIDGILEVEHYLHNVAVESFTTLDNLKAVNTKIGSIGLIDDILYYRVSESVVLPIISSASLADILSAIDFGDTVINNITNDIINNNNFINTIIDSIINNIVDTQVFQSSIINTVLSKANIEVQSLKGRRLFFAFDPNSLTDLQVKPPLPDETLPTCSNPISVNIVGEFSPLKGSTHTYNIEVVGSSSYLLTYSVKGGVINTNPNESPVQITWDTDFNELASIGVGVGCSNDVINSKYDFEFFILK